MMRSILDKKEASLRRKVKRYRILAEGVRKYLSNYPQEWGRFQSEFNQEVNVVFKELMDFERERMENGDEDSVYKLKRLFVNYLRKEFLFGDLIVWSLNKPYGYAGDHKIIDDIYKNEPKTLGFDRLFDNYFQMSAISVAVRNRKDDFKRMIQQYLEANEGRRIRIMNLGSGPCREIYEISIMNLLNNYNVHFDCYDNDQHAHDFSKERLGNPSNVHFMKENVVRLALKKDIRAIIPQQYNYIYSTGLFDYFDDRITIRLLQNLRQLLHEGGMIVISDVRDKYSNPSVHFMEWVGDWNLIYRHDDRFRELFLESGFSKDELSFYYEQQGIMQYIVARKA